MLADLLSLLDEELPLAIDLRHRLHREPELANCEEATASAIVEALGMDSTRVAGTGVVARVGEEMCSVVVRAELDALPITEETDYSYRSTNGSMHACGHDVHASALVALARAASRMAVELPAALVCLFQPSEEAYPSGAERLVREGTISDQTLGVVAAHVHPDLPWASLAIDPGPINASSDTIEITIEGVGTHAGYPHLGRDPVLALAQVVTSLYALASRRIDPVQTALITVGEIHAGTAENVIPMLATARATVRALHPEDRNMLCNLVTETADHVSRAFGCRARTTVIVGEPPVINDPLVCQIAQALAVDAKFNLSGPMRSCGSDDFSFFGEIAPIAMAFTGLAGAPGFEQQPLHHPRFLPPDDAVRVTAATQAIMYLAAATARATDGVQEIGAGAADFSIARDRRPGQTSSLAHQTPSGRS